MYIVLYLRKHKYSLNRFASVTIVHSQWNPPFFRPLRYRRPISHVDKYLQNLLLARLIVLPGPFVVAEKRQNRHLITLFTLRWLDTDL